MRKGPRRLGGGRRPKVRSDVPLFDMFSSIVALLGGQGGACAIAPPRGETCRAVRLHPPTITQRSFPSGEMSATARAPSAHQRGTFVDTEEPFPLSPPPSPHCSKEHAKHCPACPFGNLHLEENRLKTYKHWPHTKKQHDKAGFARAGFVHNPSADAGWDNVRCFACDKNLGGWEMGDDPMEEHRRRGANCPFIQAMTADDATEAAAAAIEAEEAGAMETEVTPREVGLPERDGLAHFCPSDREPWQAQTERVGARLCCL